ncbi:unnamed protein product [Mytilus coruscus]|uniref:C1q domain-containing protein n=1 Tax=Mytilus coruscus TaxID=42192 RepID=A0A6J8D0H3_MYTCO|nr:unnamed protein product [Mytilus coruscus]
MFVAPIVDNKGAPLVAIVNTTNISSHIVRSIEMPLREIINSTVECQINEKLKEDILSSKVLGKVNNKLDSLQQKIDEHMDGDNRNQMTEVNQYIATLRKEMEELKNLAITVRTENKNIDEKLEGLKATVNDMNSRVALSACVATSYTVNSQTTVKFSIIKTSEGITNQAITSFKSSGLFVCEVPGLYHISVEILSVANYAYFMIFKNDMELMRGHSNNYDLAHGDQYTTSSAIVATKLLKGDTISIKPAHTYKNIESNYSCLTIDLKKFVAPILNQKIAPLMAIVDTTDISSHIVRSIEMPLREIINSTVECKIYEMLREEVDALQQNIGDNRNQMTGVNKDIATL